MQGCGETFVDEGAIAENLPEQEILIQSFRQTMVPMLVDEDKPLRLSLLTNLFPAIKYILDEMTELHQHIHSLCAEEYLIYDRQGSMWMKKVF